MKKFQALGYGKFDNRMFYAEAENVREAWNKLWLQGQAVWYNVPFRNVVEVQQ